MNPRHLLAAPLVAAALAGPYVTEQTDPRETTTDPATPWSAESSLSATPVLPPVEIPPLDSTATPAPASADSAPALPSLDGSRARFAGAPVTDFAEVLRFDITPEWIFTRWSRVTTVTADQSLKGFRAPLVTGAKVDDVAGVITYYFGRHGLLQRVTLEGRSGDTRRLTAFLTQNYGFQAEPSLGAGMYLVRWNARPMSALRVDYAPVVRADAPHERYTLKLEINRPNEVYQMSEEFRKTLGSDQQTKRWLPF
jgi:hypothetical protein